MKSPWIALLLLAVSAAACGPADRGATRALAAGEHPFTGRWTVTGRYDGLSVGGNRWFETHRLRGTLHLTRSDVASDLGTEILGLVDSEEGCKGGSVWTDADGDRLYSVIRGTRIDRGGRGEGTITGGTGKFAGASGSYALTWTSVVHGDELRVDAFSKDVTGVIRIPAQPGERGRE